MHKRKKSAKRNTSRVRSRAERPTITISRPGNLISEIPGIIQFTPEAPSVVIVGSIRGGVDGTPVMRVDIPLDAMYGAHLHLREGDAREVEDVHSNAARSYLEERLGNPTIPLRRVFEQDTEEAGEYVAHVATLFSSQDLDKACVVVLLPDACSPGTLGWEAADTFVRYLETAAGLADTELTIVLLAEEIRAGAPWRPGRGPEEELGVQEDPRAGKLAAETVATGIPIYASRRAIEQVYGRIDAGEDIVAEPLESAYGYGFTLSDLDRYAERLREIARLPRPFGQDELNEAGSILGSAEICSHLLTEMVAGQYALALHEQFEVDVDEADYLGAEPGDLDVLMEISRRGNDRARGGALLLNGTSHYLRGSGIHAVVCFEAAQRTGFMPYYNRLILSLLQRGTAPEKVCAILAELMEADGQIPA